MYVYMHSQGTYLRWLMAQGSMFCGQGPCQRLSPGPPPHSLGLAAARLHAPGAAPARAPAGSAAAVPAPSAAAAAALLLDQPQQQREREQWVLVLQKAVVVLPALASAVLSWLHNSCQDPPPANLSLSLAAGGAADLVLRHLLLVLQGKDLACLEVQLQLLPC